MSETAKKPIGIVGASGYGGVQLVKLLLEHPQVEIVWVVIAVRASNIARFILT
jgi:N-acetyl-gamma-glutamyl-phosphate reductase